MGAIQKLSQPAYTTEITVYEKGLINSDESHKATWTPPEGYDVTSVKTNGTLGSAVKSDNTVVYTLSAAVKHSTGEGENESTDSFTVTVTQTVVDGEPAEPELHDLPVTVKIIDDIPKISSDSSTKQVSSGKSVTGTVTINYGADNGDEKTLTVNNESGSTVENTKLSYTLTNGTLVLDPSNGSYTYKANPNVNSTEEITFKITDADGDTAETLVTVTITKPEAPEYTTSISVDEEGLASGTNPSADSESAEWTAPDGYTIDSIKTNGNNGTASISDGKIKYTLTKAISHESGNGENKSTADTLVIVIKDADNNTYDATVTVTVKDDIPTISEDSLTKDVKSGYDITGTVTVNYGADNGDGKTLTINDQSVTDEETTITLENGSIVYNPTNGSYTFTAKPNITATQNITFKATDSDGDEIEKTITINITKPAAPDFTNSVEVDEEGLPSGTNPDSDSESVEWTAPEGYTIVQIKTNPTKGTAEIEENKIKYTLTTVIEHEPGSDENISQNADSFVIEVKDSKENSYDVIVSINVKDDVPSISFDENTKSASTENRVVTGTITLKYGADGKNETNSITVNSVEGKESEDLLVFELTDGTLKLNPETGEYTFNIIRNKTKDITLNFTASDSDGDTVTSTVTVKFTGYPYYDREYTISITELATTGKQLIDILRNYSVRNDLTDKEFNELIDKYTDFGSFALGEGLIENENQKKVANYSTHYTVYDSVIKYTILDLKQTRENISEEMIKAISKGIDEVLKLIV